MKKLLVVVALLFVFPLVTNAASSLASSITVEGIGELGLARKTYNLTLTTTLDYAEISVAKLNDNVTVEGAGKIPVQEGDNSLVVKLTDGTTTEEYTINIKIVRPSSDQSGNPVTGAFISGIVIGGALLVSLGIWTFTRKKGMLKI